MTRPVRQQEQRNQRERLLKNVASELHVNVRELAEIAGLTYDNNTGIIYISNIDSLPRDVLLSIMTRTAGVIEFLSGVRANVIAARDILKARLESKEAQRMLDIQEELGYARGSKTKAETSVLADEELAKLRQRVVYYSAYLEYLKSLEDSFSKQHYAAKVALDSSRSAFARLGNTGGFEDAV